VLTDPKNLQPTASVQIRREKKVVLELALHSHSHPIDNWRWGGIQLPLTGSVKSAQQPFSGRILRLSIQVLGCSTGLPNAQPCESCWARERKSLNANVCPPNLQPYMIDFKADSAIIALFKPLDGNDKCLKADVTFHFTCYSNHHGGMYG
jgi:hypothetical protein